MGHGRRRQAAVCRGGRSLCPAAAKGKAGLSALNPATGEQLWYTAGAQGALQLTAGDACIGQSAAPTVIPGLVLSTTIDGHLRAYNVTDGNDRLGFRHRRTEVSDHQRREGPKRRIARRGGAHGGGRHDVSHVRLRRCARRSAGQCAVGVFGGRKIMRTATRCAVTLGLAAGIGRPGRRRAAAGARICDQLSRPRKAAVRSTVESFCC